MKSLIEKAVGVVDDVGVETVLTLAFVAQFAAYALPFHMDEVRVHRLSGEPDVVVEVGTMVVQMPAKPHASRSARTTSGRDQKGSSRAPAASGKTLLRVPRPERVDDDPAPDEVDQLRTMENAVRITIIGPDGQPRTKIVRHTGSRDGSAAPARRPHD
jgi:hypothetical protein